MYMFSKILLIFSTICVLSVYGKYTALYVFGDSWSDDNGVLSSWKQFHYPPDPPCAMRWSNGPTWPFYLAKDYLNMSCDWQYESAGITNCSQYMNFATGGACTHNWNDPVIDTYCSNSVNNNASLPRTYSYTLFQQVSAFINANVSASIANNALFAVFIGGNDMNALLQLNGPLQEELQNLLTRDDDILSSIQTAVKQLHDAGARNFLMINLPSILATPRGLQATTNELFRDVGFEFIGTYLEKYKDATDNNFGFTDTTFHTANLYGCLTQMSEGSYGGFGGNGFNITSPCATNRDDPNTTICYDPSIAVWWDDIHPTTSFHAFIAKLINDFLNGESGCMSSPCLIKSPFSTCFNGSASIVPVLGMVLLIVGFLFL